MTISSSEKRLQLGGAIFGAGVLLVVSMLVFDLAEEKSFWDAYGLTGAVTSAVGFMLMLSGLVRDKEGESTKSSNSLHIEGSIMDSNIVTGSGNSINTAEEHG